MSRTDGPIRQQARQLRIRAWVASQLKAKFGPVQSAQRLLLSRNLGLQSITIIPRATSNRGHSLVALNRNGAIRHPRAATKASLRDLMAAVSGSIPLRHLITRAAGIAGATAAATIPVGVGANIYQQKT